MKLSHRVSMLAVAFAAYATQSLFGQAVCSFSISMVNHNRYAYDTAEECLSIPVVGHTVPFGTWGVSSNVGRVINGGQFDGWNPYCNSGPDINVEWNSCSREYVKPDLDCRRLNFPDPAGTAPYPANGYPFTDNYWHNDYVPAVGGNQTCVDQYSPCGYNVYGSAFYSIGVSPVQDWDGDNIMDTGGCKDLDGHQIWLGGNYMSVYELDENTADDLINSLYFPNVWATVRCTAEYCSATNDNNYDGWIDDLNNRSSPEYVPPYAYQDNNDDVSYSTDPFVPAKRIDATIRIGSISGYYSGPYPHGYCGNPSGEQDCPNAWPYQWDPTTCTCLCNGSPGICA